MPHLLEALTNGPRFDPADTPTVATVTRGGATLTMAFADGTQASARAETLRLRCRCAWCTRARVDGRFPDAFEDAAIVSVDPIGGYAAHLIFADGHDRGIFPWSYLRAIAEEASGAPPSRAAAAA